MKNFTSNLILFFLFFSNIACFAKNTPYQNIFSNKDSFVNVFKNKQPQTTNNQNNAFSVSISDLIKENTGPYLKKNKAIGSWVKNTIWIKNPNWIKKELA